MRSFRPQIQEQVKRGGVQFVWGHWPDVSNFQAKRCGEPQALTV